MSHEVDKLNTATPESASTLHALHLIGGGIWQNLAALRAILLTGGLIFPPDPNAKRAQKSLPLARTPISLHATKCARKAATSQNRFLSLLANSGGWSSHGKTCLSLRPQRALVKVASSCRCIDRFCLFSIWSSELQLSVCLYISKALKILTFWTLQLILRCFYERHRHGRRSPLAIFDS